MDVRDPVPMETMRVRPASERARAKKTIEFGSYGSERPPSGTYPGIPIDYTALPEEEFKTPSNARTFDQKLELRDFLVDAVERGTRHTMTCEPVMDIEMAPQPRDVVRRAISEVAGKTKPRQRYGRFTQTMGPSVRVGQAMEVEATKKKPMRAPGTADLPMGGGRNPMESPAVNPGFRRARVVEDAASTLHTGVGHAVAPPQPVHVDVTRVMRRARVGSVEAPSIPAEGGGGGGQTTYTNADITIKPRRRVVINMDQPMLEKGGPDETRGVVPLDAVVRARKSAVHTRTYAAGEAGDIHRRPMSGHMKGPRRVRVVAPGDTPDVGVVGTTPLDAPPPVMGEGTARKRHPKPEQEIRATFSPSVRKGVPISVLQNVMRVHSARLREMLDAPMKGRTNPEPMEGTTYLGSKRNPDTRVAVEPAGLAAPDGGVVQMGDTSDGPVPSRRDVGKNFQADVVAQPPGGGSPSTITHIHGDVEPDKRAYTFTDTSMDMRSEEVPVDTSGSSGHRKHAVEDDTMLACAAVTPIEPDIRPEFKHADRRPELDTSSVGVQGETVPMDPAADGTVVRRAEGDNRMDGCPVVGVNQEMDMDTATFVKRRPYWPAQEARILSGAGGLQVRV